MSSGSFVNTSDVLGGVSSGLSAYASMVAAESKADQAEFRAEQKAQDLEVQTKVERQQAKQKQEQLNQRLQDVLSQQRAVRSASGVAVGSGSAQTAREEAQEEAAEAKQRVADNFALQRIERGSQIAQTRISGDARSSIIESRGEQRALQQFAGFSANLAGNIEQRQEYEEDTGEKIEVDNTDDIQSQGSDGDYKGDNERYAPYDSSLDFGSNDYGGLY